MSQDRQPPPGIWQHRPFQWFVLFLIGFAFCIWLAAVGIPAPIILYLLLACIGIPVGRLYYARRAKRALQSEEAFEQDWENRQQLHGHLLQDARKKYAAAPAGQWRIYYNVGRGERARELLKGRIIEFGSDGTGHYDAINKAGLDMPVQVSFRYKPAQHPGFLAVQLVEPELHGWRDVQFGFELNTTATDPCLLLWFDSDNPLPEDLAELWPFQGEFLRENPNP